MSATVRPEWGRPLSAPTTGNLEAGESHEIFSGDSTGSWSHDAEGNGAIQTKDGHPSTIAAGLQLVRDHLTGDEPSLMVEDEHGRQAVFALYPIVPSDDLPAAEAARP
jgi:hypothetical protein